MGVECMSSRHQSPRLSPDHADDVEIEDVQSENLVPPDGGYGWVCVVSCFTINCFTWGAVSVSTTRMPKSHVVLYRVTGS